MLHLVDVSAAALDLAHRTLSMLDDVEIVLHEATYEVGLTQIAAERHRSELRGEQGRDQNALLAERAALGQQVRAAYMIGRQEELKLLLNQSNPASLGRTLAYYGYFAQQRGSKIEAIQGRELKLQQLVAEIDQQGAQLRALEGEASGEMIRSH